MKIEVVGETCRRSRQVVVLRIAYAAVTSLGER